MESSIMSPASTSSVLATYISMAYLINAGANAGNYIPQAQNGYSVGLLAECPGILNNITISPRVLKRLTVVLHEDTPQGIVRKSLTLAEADKFVASNKNVDLRNRKTVLYAVGFLDRSSLPHSRTLANTYVRKGYNVFVTETFALLNYVYPKSVRIARVIGQKLGEFLVNLSEQGMKAENLELVGISLGAHIVGYAAKHFYAATGKKPSRITGLDPSGPCFRAIPPEMRLNRSDGDKVDIIHTNMDGFGIADQLGHVDFYVNGGEYQPHDILLMPCLIVCSHVKSLLYWWQALEHPKQFIGVECDSIQDARLSNCFQNNVTNIMGADTDFSKQGIFYLGTNYLFPYYRGEDGLKKDKEIFSSTLQFMNSNSFSIGK